MFEHNSAQVRALNEQMNRVPALSITLTGGLWFGAGAVESLDEVIRFGLLLFAGLSNLVLVLACIRIRDVLASYFEKIAEFDPTSAASGRPQRAKLGQLGNYSMITLYSLLMTTAAALSFMGAIVFFWPEEAFPYTRLQGLVVLVLFLLLAGIRLLWGRASPR